MRSSRHPSKSLWLAAMLLVLPLFAFADQKDDLYAKGTAAVNSGDAIAARDAFCAINDPAYKDSAQQCTTYKGEATRQMNRYNQNYTDCVGLFQTGDLNGAELKCKNVKAGAFVDMAKQQLVQIANQRKELAAQAAADSAKKAGDAEAAKKAAADAEAARIAAANAAAQQKPANNAVKETKREVDVAATLAAAHKAEMKKDYKAARRWYREVQSVDLKNADAKAGLEALPKEDVAGSSASEEDPVLAKAIGDFYKGNYASSEGALNYSLGLGAKKPGLTNFYMGASILTRYYLAGANDPRLLQDAKRLFKDAQAIDGFVVPEKMVSPKIIKVFKDATGAPSQ